MSNPTAVAATQAIHNPKGDLNKGFCAGEITIDGIRYEVIVMHFDEDGNQIDCSQTKLTKQAQKTALECLDLLSHYRSTKSPLNRVYFDRQSQRAFFVVQSPHSRHLIEEDFPEAELNDHDYNSFTQSAHHFNSRSSSRSIHEVTGLFYMLITDANYHEDNSPTPQRTRRDSESTTTSQDSFATATQSAQGLQGLEDMADTGHNDLLDDSDEESTGNHAVAAATPAPPKSPPQSREADLQDLETLRSTGVEDLEEACRQEERTASLGSRGGSTASEESSDDETLLHRGSSVLWPTSVPTSENTNRPCSKRLGTSVLPTTELKPPRATPSPGVYSPDRKERVEQIQSAEPTSPRRVAAFTLNGKPPTFPDVTPHSDSDRPPFSTAAERKKRTLAAASRRPTLAEPNKPRMAELEDGRQVLEQREQGLPEGITDDEGSGVEALQPQKESSLEASPSSRLSWLRGLFGGQKETPPPQKQTKKDQEEESPLPHTNSSITRRVNPAQINNLPSSQRRSSEDGVEELLRRLNSSLHTHQ